MGVPQTASFLYLLLILCHCGHDHMVVGFTTTCAISAYHH
jgi:sterol desaturase/sphingolipid hydroxylase (fatty acid hydroxylase superfamily)